MQTFLSDNLRTADLSTSRPMSIRLNTPHSMQTSHQLPPTQKTFHRSIRSDHLLQHGHRAQRMDGEKRNTSLASLPARRRSPPRAPPSSNLPTTKCPTRPSNPTNNANIPKNLRTRPCTHNSNLVPDPPITPERVFPTTYDDTLSGDYVLISHLMLLNTTILQAYTLEACRRLSC